MNRFRTKKKGKDDMAIGRPSMEAESSGPFKMFGKNKKSQEGIKPDVDIAVALPSSDDFRTSLLMTGLSARFSMLREQDDPKTKVGKASDDSVLFPKRQSRLVDFGGFGGGLHNIDEVESLKAPQFARTHSFQSDDASSINGSIMNRAKPTDGNNLFGGRQKIYKIPAGGSGAVSGRVLYDDDVAQSSFQRWRQTEKGRKSSEEERTNDVSEPEVQDYSRRRETGSTTSSGPSIGRNSSAATSFTSSQPAPSLKDWQPSTVPAITNNNITNPPAGVERSVTRTRRLYEQGLTQDLQDQQSSAMSRMDTISRQRPFGARTPDLTPPVPSPTAATFGDRVMERRPILGKNSAPNLRSFSPSVPIAQPSPAHPSPAHPSGKFSAEKSSFGVTSPPLSPPISETEEHPVLPIQPNDRGKATALGVFNRPAQKYDESQYTQRQRQLQHGRETPTQQDSDSSGYGGRSRSSSSQRLPRVTHEKLSGPQGSSTNPSFFDDSDAEQDKHASTSSQLAANRPDDQEHPAFRKSALPTPLSLSSRNSDEFVLPAEKSPFLEAGWESQPSKESPTLPVATGLSGMVRQHLRNDSEASSVYNTTSQDQEPESQSPAHHRMAPQAANANVWNLSEADWDMGDDGTKTNRPPSASATETVRRGSGTDEFARHLADGARRVREKLTSYVDSDTEREQEQERPPLPPVPHAESTKDFGAPRQGALGILKSKSSRGSLFNKQERSQERPKSSRSQPSSPPRPKAPIESEVRRGNDAPSAEPPAETEAQAPAPEGGETIHAGLKAFRQARRELQKMKELEAQQRHKSPQKPKVGTREGGGPPPAMFNRMPSEETRHSGGSTGGSRPPSERERSGSETSNGGSGRAGSRGPRARNEPVAWEEQQTPGYPRQSPMWSPVTQHSSSGAPSPALQPQARQRTPYEPTQSSPITSPTGQSYFSNGASGNYIDPPGKRVVRKRDISEPTFVSTTSRVPSTPIDGQQYPRSKTGTFLGSTASTPNLHAPVSAPPLPPINPRRKNGQGVTRQSDEGLPSPRLPPAFGEEGYAGVQTSDEEGGSQLPRQGLRRMTSESNVSRERTSPPRLADRPPLPRTNMSSNSMPGGMI